MFAKSHWSDYMTSSYAGIHDRKCSDCSSIIALQGPRTFVGSVLVEEVDMHHLFCFFPFAHPHAAPTQCL